MSRSDSLRFDLLRLPLLFVVVSIAIVASASAGPVVGFKETFPALAGTGSWGGGSAYANPGSGGVDGDGYLRISTSLPAFLGGFSRGSEYAGDYVAAGVTKIKLSLNDVNGDEPIEVHVNIGYSTGLTANVWQYDIGFIPPAGAWQQFTVPLNGPTGWTHTIGTGTFTDAITNADRLLVRHDLAPFAQTPDALLGDFGLDDVTLTNDNVGVEGAPFAASPVWLSAPAPNPARGPVTFAFRGPAGEAVKLEIVDVLGRRVLATALEGGAAARTWTWDGRDARGALAPAGSYRVRAYGASGGTSRAFVLVR